MGVTRFLDFPGHHSIFYYLLAAVLTGIFLQALGIGGLFFFKRSGEKRANLCYGLLLIAFSLTLLHYILLMTGIPERFPHMYFLPVYFTLSFPPLLFYHIKLNLYPAYRFRRSDGKHLILPVGQFLFFLGVFLSPIAYKSHVERAFFNPFYGASETALYLLTFFAYLYFGYRYIQEKRRHLRTSRDTQLVRYLSKLVQVLFILFCVHTVFVLTDFISYELMHINLRAVKPYAAFGILSFAALVLWLSTYGFQVLVWGRKVLK
ncbi:MAG: hypothetical protein IPN20_01060 [Haliscomenobacter sp.]|nr:hypothetical protein [Haliscomenobacter sp.]MBK8652538.1 hypothetical protein [Haliscomenobacter sp.]